MNRFVLIGSGLIAMFSLAACSPSVKTLSSEELTAANNASSKYFSSKSVIFNGQQIKGQSAGCSNIDSNKDSYVSCPGTVPSTVKDPATGKSIEVQMNDATVQCGVSKEASGCKQ